MVNYEYNANLEVFKRTDNRGNYLYVNITEAQRIISLLDLGYSVNRIINKVKLSNPKGTDSTIRSFVKNYKEGNIIIPENAPAPSHVFDTITDGDRIDELEKRVTVLEKKLSVEEPKKSWKKRLGL